VIPVETLLGPGKSQRDIARVLGVATGICTEKAAVGEQNLSSEGD